MAIEQVNVAKVDLNDAADYYGGYKAPKLLKAGRFMRALSDWRGQYESSTFDVLMKDFDRDMRGRLAGVTSRYLLNRTIIARIISDANRRLELTPRTLGIGIVREYEPLPNFEFRFRCQDYLARFSGENRDARQIPKRTLSRTDFPDLPNDLIGKPVPILYGDLSSKASATPPPAIALVWNPDGGFWNTNVEGTGFSIHHLGWGTVNPASAAAVPTGVALAVTAGGSIQPGQGPIDLYNVAVTAVDASGVESDPEYFNWHEPIYPYAATITAANSKIDVSWAASAGAVGYRIYVGYAYHDQAFCRIQTVATAISIDRVVPFGEQPTNANLPTGGEMIEFAESWIYAVSALMADGETLLSQECYGKSQGYRRPLRITWGAVTGAIEYYVYRRKAQNKGIKAPWMDKAPEETSQWDRRWTIAAGTTAFDDDLLDTGVELVEGTTITNGLIPLVYVGKETSLHDGSHWMRFLVAGHAVKEITGLAVNDEVIGADSLGPQLLVPGYAPYSTYFPATGSPEYRDINGRRYTFIYARGPVAAEVARGDKRAAVNLKGIEDVGDGSGTLITDIFEQYNHFMNNWAIGDYQSGAWATESPLWPDVTPELTVVDNTSFVNAKAIADARIVGGYEGGGAIGAEGEFENLADLIAKWNLSCDCFSGPSARSQFSIWMLDDSVTAYDDASHQLYTQNRDIIKSTFKVRIVDSEWMNEIPYVYRRHFQRNSWLSKGTDSDATSITNYGETKRAEELTFWFIREGTVAQDIVERKLARGADPPYAVEFDLNLPGLSLELGQFFAFQHVEMIGPDPAAKHLIWLQRFEFDGDSFTCSISGRLRSLEHLA